MKWNISLGLNKISMKSNTKKDTPFNFSKPKVAIIYKELSI